MEKEVFLIVGLGNPGAEYAHTRHNAGFDTLERVAEHYGVTSWKRRAKGMAAEITRGDKKIVLCQPQTYMNASGECVAEMMRWYHCPPERLLVLYDDIDLPPGKVRVRRNGGPGTHNGMRSIVGQLGHSEFPRVRIGTGDRPAGSDLVSWVLGRCAPEEQPAMDAAFELGAACAADWVENGIDHAMQMGNRPPKAEAVKKETDGS